MLSKYTSKDSKSEAKIVLWHFDWKKSQKNLDEKLDDKR
jgi:hypothetical protein